MTAKIATGARATITSSLQSDVVTYTERGAWVSEFRLRGYNVRATGFAALKVADLKKGAKLTVQGYTATRTWVSGNNDRYGEQQAVLKSRSQMNRIQATYITVH